METYLAHHGILGMKWGIRRYQTKDGTLTATGKIRYGRKMTAQRKAAARKAAQTKKRNAEAKAKEAAKREADERAGRPRDVSTMSDQEIRDFLNRKDLEKRYLAEVSPKQVEKGQSAAQKYLGMLGDTLASTVVKGIATKLASNLLKSIFEEDTNSNKKNDDDRDKSNEYSSSSEKKAKDPKAPKTEKKPKEPKESIFDTIKNEKANRESRAESATKEKVFTGTVEGGRKYTEEHKTKWENKTIIDVDPVQYQKAETFVRSLPSHNMNILALPPARDY